MSRSVFHPPVLGSLLALSAACSTPISPYAYIDEEAEPDPDDTSDPAPTVDASVGRRDGGVPRVDAGVGMRDAGVLLTRDAGVPRDAGVGGGSTNCMQVPTANYGSLLVDGCGSRPTVSCSEPNRTSQQVINQYLALLAEKCGSPAAASIGVVFRSDGCPTNLGYQGAGVRGRVSSCLQEVLENSRIGCSLTCALIGPAAP